jgi:hypothetical protein
MMTLDHDCADFSCDLKWPYQYTRTSLQRIAKASTIISITGSSINRGKECSSDIKELRWLDESFLHSLASELNIQAYTKEFVSNMDLLVKICVWPSLVWGYATTKGIFAPTRATSSNLRSNYLEGGSGAPKWYRNNYHLPGH